MMPFVLTLLTAIAAFAVIRGKDPAREVTSTSAYLVVCWLIGHTIGSIIGMTALFVTIYAIVSLFK